jgi:hypothetical protein
MLGLLGVIVGSAASIEKIRLIHAYARKLQEVEKSPDGMFGNVACFEDSQFLGLLDRS